MKKRCDNCGYDPYCLSDTSTTKRLIGNKEGVVFFKRFVWCIFYILAMVFVIYLLS